MKNTIFIIIAFAFHLNSCIHCMHNEIALQSKIINDTNLINSDTTKNTSNNIHIKYFSLLTAISADWVGGIAGSGSGTEYYFKIRINTKDQIQFDTAWIDSKAFRIFISKETKAISNNQIKYFIGDTIILRVSDNQYSKSQTKNKNIHNKPIKYEGVALIGYNVNNKREYFTIKEIKKQKSPNRP
jgi:hypothetical protein